MKLRHGIIAGLVLLGVGVSPALAADKGGSDFLELPKASQASPWSGVYLGLHGGYGVASIDVSAGPFGIDGLSAQGFVGGVHGGLDYQFAGTPFVARARAAYTWGNVEFQVTPGLASVAITDGWSADIGLGYDMGRALPYIMVGYTETQTAAKFLGTSVSSPDLEGMRYGGGIEFKPQNVSNLTFALDVTYTDYKDLNFGPITVDADDWRAMLRVNFRVGG